MNCNPTNCHNFKNAEELGRCPFISVCTDDCVYVWKSFYDNSDKERDYEFEIDNLQDEVEELQRFISNLEGSVEDLTCASADWEQKYNEVVSDLSKILPAESIDKLSTYIDNHQVGEWAEKVVEEGSIINACRTR